MSIKVRSTSVSFTITLSAQPISYHNQHSLTQPYCNFLLFLLIFCPNEICLIVAFTFILLTCNNTIRSVLLKARKKNYWDTRHFFHKKRSSNLPNQQTKNKFVDGLWCFLWDDALCFHLTLIYWEPVSTDFIDQTKKVYNIYEFSCFPWRSPKSLLKYDSFLPPMISSSFSFNF